jgi:hypothetical protein
MTTEATTLITDTDAIDADAIWQRLSPERQAQIGAHVIALHMTWLAADVEDLSPDLKDAFEKQGDMLFETLETVVLAAIESVMPDIPSDAAASHGAAVQ